MKFLSGEIKRETMELSELLSEGMEGRTVKTNGAVHTIRDMGNITFIILRKKDGLLQCVYEKGTDGPDISALKEASAVTVQGTAARNEKAPGGMEIRLERIEVLSEPAEPMPIPIAKWRMNTTLETNLDLRPISLRNIRERARFKIQEGIVKGFRSFLDDQGFTEIHTPKLGSKGAEGGANIFKLDYFHRPAVLAQSPQFYKQMMVGVFERVYETAPVFRAEKHNTKRHLNEYTSLDLEMGYIDGFEDIMEIETGIFQRIMQVLKTRYAGELAVLEITLPRTDRIPSVRFAEAKKLVSEKYGRPIKNPYDLEPEEEALIGRYFKEEYDADFVFITHYPSKKRPFYAMDDPQDKTFTLSFDCLLGGMEITTGGQRIHDYSMLLEKMASRGMSREGIESYLSAFKYGMPPHGGLGIGLERLAMKLTGGDNVRETTLFPRDLCRLEP